MRPDVRKVALFLGLTFFVSWSLATLFFGLGGRWNTAAATAMAVVYMFVPGSMAIVVQKLIYKEPLKKPLGISFRLNWWFLVAWLLPPIFAFATIGVSLVLPQVEYSPDMSGVLERYEALLSPEQFEQIQGQIATSPMHPIWIGLLLGLMAGVTVNAVAAFGEELGWRGLLQRELGEMGFWTSSAIIGLIWGIWHAPIILMGHNYPQHPVAGVFLMTLLSLLLSPLFSYVRIKAKSVIAAAVLHGTLNATAGLAILVIKGGNDLLVGVTGLAGLIVLLLANGVLYLGIRGHNTDLQDGGT